MIHNNRRKIIIAGGTGFIGKKVVEILENNKINCFVLTRNTNKINSKYVTYITLDLNNLTTDDCSNINKKYGPFEAGIYLAANIPKIGEKKESYSQAGISTLFPTINFMEGFAPFLKKIIYASSVDVYGNTDVDFYNEKAETKATTPYGVAKLCGENYLKSIASKYNIKYLVLRFSQVYGPFEPIVRIIPILIKTVKENQIFTLYGKGEEKRRFLYVEDAALSVFCALKYNDSGIFNIAGKSINSINGLIKIVENIYKKEIKIKYEESKITTHNNIPKINKAKKILFYNPKYSLMAGIRKIFKEENNELK